MSTDGEGRERYRMVGKKSEGQGRSLEEMEEGWRRTGGEKR